MAIIFDGREFAKQKEDMLGMRVFGLKARGIYPKLASIIVGNDPASELYVNLKKKAAERIGAEVDIYKLKENSKANEVLNLIETLDTDENVHGIMVQLPLPKTFTKEKSAIIEAIDPEKDIDGLRDDSNFSHPTAMAVMQIVRESGAKSKKICVVGSGMVGGALAIEIKNGGFDQVFDTKDADIVVSATGEPGIIKADSIKKGAVVIDVGSPKGDIDFEDVSKKASFVTPVPGGVGPVTISCLLENLILAASHKD